MNGRMRLSSAKCKCIENGSSECIRAAQSCLMYLDSSHGLPSVYRLTVSAEIMGGWRAAEKRPSSSTGRSSMLILSARALNGALRCCSRGLSLLVFVSLRRIHIAVAVTVAHPSSPSDILRV